MELTLGLNFKIKVKSNKILIDPFQALMADNIHFDTDRTESTAS